MVLDEGFYHAWEQKGNAGKMKRKGVGPSYFVRWKKDGRVRTEIDSYTIEGKGGKWWRNCNDLSCRRAETGRQGTCMRAHEKKEYVRSNHVQEKGVQEGDHNQVQHWSKVDCPTEI